MLKFEGFRKIYLEISWHSYLPNSYIFGPEPGIPTIPLATIDGPQAQPVFPVLPQDLSFVGRRRRKSARNFKTREKARLRRAKIRSRRDQG